MFHSVWLPADAPGQLYLHSMPGHYEPFEIAKQEVDLKRITHVVWLAPPEEAGRKSPDYAHAIQASDVAWEQETLPVPDYGVPKDWNAFLDLARSLAERLREGEHVLIHCGAGIGRTGTLAVSVVMALGMNQDDAYRAVRKAGSHPETSDQKQLVEWAAAQLSA